MLISIRLKIYLNKNILTFNTISGSLLFAKLTGKAVETSKTFQLVLLKYNICYPEHNRSKHFMQNLPIIKPNRACINYEERC